MQETVSVFEKIRGTLTPTFYSTAEREGQKLEGKRMEEQERQKAEEFVRANMYRRPGASGPTALTPRCVDGGYTPDQVVEFDGDSFARPGADGGYVEALLKVAKDNGIEISGPEAVEFIANIVRGFGRRFFNHTDAHADHHNHEHKEGNRAIGCGHEAKAVQFPDEYGVDPNVMQSAIDTIVGNKVSSVNVVLDREHTEAAVLIVKGDTYSVKPWNAGKTEMNFIYDADIDAQVMSAIWSQAQTDSRFANVALSEFQAAANVQTGHTVEKLASSKGKPTFIVTFDESGEPTVVRA